MIIVECIDKDQKNWLNFELKIDRNDIIEK